MIHTVEDSGDWTIEGVNVLTEQSAWVIRKRLVQMM